MIYRVSNTFLILILSSAYSNFYCIPGAYLLLIFFNVPKPSQSLTFRTLLDQFCTSHLLQYLACRCIQMCFSIYHTKISNLDAFKNSYIIQKFLIWMVFVVIILNSTNCLHILSLKCSTFLSQDAFWPNKNISGQDGHFKNSSYIHKLLFVNFAIISC